MGSCKRRQGVNGLRIGTGKSVQARERKQSHGNVREFSISELARMPQDMARGLVRMLKDSNKPSKIQRSAKGEK